MSLEKTSTHLLYYSTIKRNFCVISAIILALLAISCCCFLAAKMQTIRQKQEQIAASLTLPDNITAVMQDVMNQLREQRYL